MSYGKIIDFWFSELQPRQWWFKDEAVDCEIRQRFQAVHDSAVKGELHAWRAETLGRLAEIIVLDQFSRNLYRGTALAFAHDVAALVLAQEAVNGCALQLLSPAQATFLLMPYMHSESLAVHEQSVELHRRPGLETRLEWELKHKAIIERFGRYPHRNAVLGRASTPEELAFLTQPGSSF
jgi:uncharacterized protein (DUF924 family)